MTASSPTSHHPTRLLTLSFDDGFRASTLKTAELFERFGLRAEFNVVATFGQGKPAIHGDWALWNDLVARGHSVQPHGYNHTDKSQVGFGEGRDLILRCLDLFATKPPRLLPRAVDLLFSLQRLHARTGAVATDHRAGVPNGGGADQPVAAGEYSTPDHGGWQDAEEWLDRCMDDLLARDHGWLIYCAHGLDGEGWGPLRSEYLERMLERLVQSENLGLLPARDVLDRFGAKVE
jgi:peptidoglycan/xylan/chitin deacetylase (PgdA/CDA1 family)